MSAEPRQGNWPTTGRFNPPRKGCARRLRNEREIELAALRRAPEAGTGKPDAKRKHPLVAAAMRKGQL